MIEIKPFRGFRYNPARVRDLDRVLAPPYDILTPELQESLYESHAYNIVRLTNGKDYGSDTPEDNRYSRAASWLHEWIEKGILTQDPQPSLYITSHTYKRPHWPNGPQSSDTRDQFGFIGMFKLRPLNSGDLYPHEKTLGAPKEDRYKLLGACRANLCQVFLLYSDPTGKIEKLLRSRVRGKAPKSSFETAHGSHHGLWVDPDPAFHAKIQALIQKSSLLIADGHHRYETALEFWRNNPGRTAPGSRAPQGNGRPSLASREAGRTDPPWSHVLVYLTRMEGDGVTVYPTYRSVGGLDRNEVAEFIRQLRAGCKVRGLPVDRENPQKMSRKLVAEVDKWASKTGFAVYAAESEEILLVDPRNAKGSRSALSKMPAPLRPLSVAVLHSVFLDPLLSGGAKASPRTIEYSVDPVEALRGVDQGRFQIAFFLPPVGPRKILDVVRRAVVFPPKTTYFYPKLLSGLVLNKWETMPGTT